jgi:hypothetical protein
MAFLRAPDNGKQLRANMAAFNGSTGAARASSEIRCRLSGVRLEQVDSLRGSNSLGESASNDKS